MTTLAPERPAKRPAKIGPRWLVTGQVLCREGDPPGPAYVICSGRLRVYRRDLTSPDRMVELAKLGAGDIIGELAPLLDQPRNASVQAIEPTQILELPLAQLQALIQNQASLQRVVAAALLDRSGLSPDEIEPIAERLGMRLAEASAAAGAPAREWPTPTHDAKLLYAKPTTCPVCGTRFASLMVHPHKVQVGQRASDFHQGYRSELNPYEYEVWVCPNDLYAALAADFDGLRTAHTSQAQIAEVVEHTIAEWGGDLPNFNAERSPELREKSLLLALGQYKLREMGPLRQAAIMHRLAWCARERGDAQREQDWLAQALDAYTVAFFELGGSDVKEELRLQYLCGELHVRLGQLSDGMTWFAQALRHPQLNEHPVWERTLKERWTELRQEGPALDTLPTATVAQA